MIFYIIKNYIIIIICFVFITDINECLSNNGGCDQNCINQPGTYHCTCNEGFDLSSDKHYCNGKYPTIIIKTVMIVKVWDRVLCVDYNEGQFHYTLYYCNYNTQIHYNDLFHFFI